MASSRTVPKAVLRWIRAKLTAGSTIFEMWLGLRVIQTQPPIASSEEFAFFSRARSSSLFPLWAVPSQA